MIQEIYVCNIKLCYMMYNKSVFSKPCVEEYRTKNCWTGNYLSCQKIRKIKRENGGTQVLHII